jgi:hypothetical protein
MEEGKEATEEEVKLRKAKLLEEYAAAKTKLQTLQDAVRTEAMVLHDLTEYLKNGGEGGQVAISLMLDSYLADTLANLIRDMWAACIEMDQLERKVSGLGIPASD